MSPPRSRTLVVGDVHGCAAELGRLVERADPTEVVLVGDLFTKGPDPEGVWGLVGDRGWRAVLGNHDERLLAVVDGTRPADAHGHEVVARLNARDPAWLAFVRTLPLFLEVAGWTVVHAGLRPDGSLAHTTREMALNIRRWPGDSPADAHWHAQYSGTRRVVFGHDAVRGPVRVERDGVPLLVGLDSGCVYGGALSGYVIEEDRVLQVPAAAAYAPITGRARRR